MKTQAELEEQYRRADLAVLSDLYFSCEGASARRKHFEDTWLAVGFQARDADVTLQQVARLLGPPDLAAGTLLCGRVGWLMQSVDSSGEQDVIVGFDVESGVIRGFWSNGVTPKCSPARDMVSFEESEMKQATASNKTVDRTGAHDSARPLP